LNTQNPRVRRLKALVDLYQSRSRVFVSTSKGTFVVGVVKTGYVLHSIAVRGIEPVSTRYIDTDERIFDGHGWNLDRLRVFVEENL